MAGFNFINRFYYGKAGQADYTPDQLPANRRALFFEMLRVRFTGVIGINLLYLLFCLPAILWTGMNLLMMLTGVEDGTAIDFIGGGYMSLYLLIMIPCLGLAGVGATGEMYVLRNWARDQHAFVMSDFKDAIKGNWKNGLVVGLINGFSLLLLYICYTFYGQMAAQTIFWVVPQMLSVVLVVIWWMMNMLIYPMMVTYEMKLGQLLRNSAIMAVARLPLSFLFLVCTSVIPALIALYVPYGWIAMVIIYLILGFGLTGFVYASYANSCFDKFLNPRIDGAPVNMGLRQESDEDEDEVEDLNPVDKGN